MFLIIFLVGCATTPKLMPTPNIYINGGGYPEARAAPSLQSNKVDLMSVTDRVPETADDRTHVYGTVRSASVGFSSAIVEIGDDLTWQALVKLSEASSRDTSPTMRTRLRAKVGRFPPTCASRIRR